MLGRFPEAVVAEKPDLVLWQVGTNSVLRDQDPAKVDAAIGEGLERLKQMDTDVVLIDPQYAPRVITKASADGLSASERLAFAKAYALLGGDQMFRDDWRAFGILSGAVIAATSWAAPFNVKPSRPTHQAAPGSVPAGRLKLSPNGKAGGVSASTGFCKGKSGGDLLYVF